MVEEFSDYLSVITQRVETNYRLRKVKDTRILIEYCGSPTKCEILGT